MKPLSILTLTLVLSGLASAALADGPKTREQVKKELVEAIRTGDILATGETGLTLREQSPGRYPPRPVVAGKTRTEVAAETAEAIRNGDVVATGETGQTLREVFPSRYPAAPVVAGKSRSEVRTQLAAAIRDGDLIPAGEGSLTLRERNPELYAHRSQAPRVATVPEDSAPR